jgi:hypothetical protein
MRIAPHSRQQCPQSHGDLNAQRHIDGYDDRENGIPDHAASIATTLSSITRAVVSVPACGETLRQHHRLDAAVGQEASRFEGAAAAGLGITAAGSEIRGTQRHARVIAGRRQVNRSEFSGGYFC